MDPAPVADRPLLAPLPPEVDPALAAAVAADRAAIAGLAALAAARTTATATVTETPAVVLADVDAPATKAATCPIPGVSSGGGTCPVGFGPGGSRRTPADLVVRKLLRIPDRPADLTNKAVYAAFQRSMLISAIRCTLTYVIFPFVLPTLHFLKGGAPVIGVLVGSFALVCDVFTIRRFFAVDHKYRWYFSTIAFCIMCLVATLWVGDVADIARSLLS
ncbi:hypothetical protein KSP35_14385 [Aquihabitans sp. G128]|uniref:hypothetical protein n=1 Tax=Aquihabitans sp. G128 TaxID=2849779 RepID=UPI001C20F747|nr:hypothetical protein [Aquihabitans sp. G128]QXC59570.1 hypothetical protein KSP35_14385 [Aquihabitans sp. G128]